MKCLPRLYVAVPMFAMVAVGCAQDDKKVDSAAASATSGGASTASPTSNANAATGGTSTASSTSGIATPTTVPRGTAGAHVWFDTSVSILVRHHWWYYGWGQPDITGDACFSLARKDMTPAQLTGLANTQLVAFTDDCMADGTSYYDLIVFDADGTSSTYRDTGCPSLRLDGATAMLYNLETNWLSSSLKTPATCPK